MRALNPDRVSCRMKPRWVSHFTSQLALQRNQ